MDKIIEFHLDSSSLSTVNFNLDNGDKLIIPVEKKHSNKKTTSLIAPKREIDVLMDMIPDNISMVNHDEKNIEIYNKENVIECFSQDVSAVRKAKEKKVIKIIVLDAFSLDKKLMGLLEAEVKLIRALFAKNNIATTLYYAYAINSANYEAYKQENFSLFQAQSFPMSVAQLESYDIALSLEGMADKFREDEHFFQSLIDYIIDLKKQPD